MRAVDPQIRNAPGRAQQQVLSRCSRPATRAAPGPRLATALKSGLLDMYRIPDGCAPGTRCLMRTTRREFLGFGESVTRKLFSAERPAVTLKKVSRADRRQKVKSTGSQKRRQISDTTIVKSTVRVPRQVNAMAFRPDAW